MNPASSPAGRWKNGTPPTRRWKVISTRCASATSRCSASSSCACSNAPSAARPPNRTAPPPQLAAEEMDRIVTEWFAEVLQISPTGTDQMLSTRGRLALLLADMPGKWQDQFLRPGPWPEEFVSAMRETFLRAGPDFQLSKMTPRPLDLGPITTLTNLGRLPYFRMVLVWIAVRAAAGRRFLADPRRIRAGPIPPAAVDRLVPAKCLTPRTFPWRRRRVSSAAGACSFFIPARCC